MISFTIVPPWLYIHNCHAVVVIVISPLSGFFIAAKDLLCRSCTNLPIPRRPPSKDPEMCENVLNSTLCPCVKLFYVLLGYYTMYNCKPDTFQTGFEEPEI